MVVRRRAKVAADRSKAAGKAKNPVAGTSRGTAETKMTEVEVTTKADTKSQNEVNKEAATIMSKDRRQVDDKQRSAGLSQAKINVMKTMIYIVMKTMIYIVMKTMIYIVMKNHDLTWWKPWSNLMKTMI